MFISSSCSKLLIWVLVSFPSLLVPYIFSLISLFVVFTTSFILQPYSTVSVSSLTTSVLNSASDRLTIFSSLRSFLEFWSVLSFGPYSFVLAHLLHCKGWSLRYSPGQGNPHCWLWCYMWGRGPRGNNAACLDLSCPSVTSTTSHKQIGPFGCWFLGGWVCVCSRTPWVPPMDSAVRLGVSAAAVTPTGFYS